MQKEKNKKVVKQKPTNKEDFSKVKSDSCYGVMKYKDGHIEERKF